MMKLTYSLQILLLFDSQGRQSLIVEFDCFWRENYKADKTKIANGNIAFKLGS